MFSGEGECVPFSTSLYPTGNVEDWLLEVENTMRGSLREILNRALLVYPEVTYYSVRHFKAAPLSAHNFTIYVRASRRIRHIIISRRHPTFRSLFSKAFDSFRIQQLSRRHHLYLS